MAVAKGKSKTAKGKTKSVWFGLFVFSFFIFAFNFFGSVPDYKIGDVATQEITAPFKLIVLNPDDTKALREKAALRVPAIFRFDPRVADEAESNLLATLNYKREEFQYQLEESRLIAAVNGRRGEFRNELEPVFARGAAQPKEILLPRFQRLAGNFLRQNKNLPLTTNLLELWAQGESDETIRSALAARLRNATGRYIRADTFPPDFKPGPQARIVPATNAGEKLTADFVERNSLVTQRSNVLTLTRARTELVKSFPPEELHTGRILAAMLRENCFLELELTRAARAKKTDALWVADHYEPGDAIVRSGQAVDAKVMAALDQLREKMKAGQLEQQIAATRAQSQQNHWLLVSVAALSLVLLLAILQLAKRKTPASVLPVKLSGGNAGDMLIACPACEEKIVVPLAGIRELALPPADEASAAAWRQRALSAEARAETATKAAREGLLSHLAHLLKDKLVMKLARHRAELLDTQEKAGMSVAALEARLREVNAPLQERLAAYQSRIAELEKELTVRGEENRELIKAKIQLARTQSEIAQAKEQMELN